MEKDNGTIYIKPEAEELRKYRTVDDWLTDVMAERTGSTKTRAAYLNYFHNFVVWAQSDMEECRKLDHPATPNDIVEIAVDRLKEDIMSDWAERAAKKWFMWMCGDGGLARTTAKTRYGVVRSFFRCNRIKFIGKTPSATVRTRYIIPDKEKLQKMWKVADLFEKIRIGLLNDTGMRPEDAVNLNYEIIRDSFEENEEYIYMTNVSEKEDQPFAVCLTRTTTRLMRTYFELRMKAGEVIADGTPIMTRKHSPGQHIGTNQLYRDILELGRKVGIRISPKYFRKRFRTECSPIIGRDATMKMAGWKIPGAGSHYFLPPKSKTVEEYKRVERIICLEDVATDLDIAAQKRMAAEMLRAAGLDPEGLLTDAGVGDNVKDQADYLTKQLVGLMNIVKVSNNVHGNNIPKMGPVSLV